MERGEKEWRPSVPVNSSHLSPGLFFNCSALPAGSSLLWSSATLFFAAFHEYHFAKQLLWGFLAPEITFDHLPLCTCMGVPGIRRTQYLPHAGLFKSPLNLKSQTLLKCFFSPPVYSLKSSATAFKVLAAKGSESTESVCIQVRLWEGPKPSSLCPPGAKNACFLCKLHLKTKGRWHKNREETCCPLHQGSLV